MEKAKSALKAAAIGYMLAVSGADHPADPQGFVGDSTPTTSPDAPANPAPVVCRRRAMPAITPLPATAAVRRPHIGAWCAPCRRRRCPDLLPHRWQTPHRRRPPAAQRAPAAQLPAAPKLRPDPDTRHPHTPTPTATTTPHPGPPRDAGTLPTDPNTNTPVTPALFNPFNPGDWIGAIGGWLTGSGSASLPDISAW
ncbi:hypothetical protein ACU686_10000 [Yinghuangia aomiensis]